MKKILMLVLCLMLAAGCAAAETAECAASLLETEAFERYPSYVYDDATGRWSVHSVQADALLDRFWTVGKSSELCVFYLEAEGNALTGVWSPVLRLCYSKVNDINATAVSILVDGVRYDLAASSEIITRERLRAEKISAPLNELGLEAVRAMQEGKNVSVRLLGDEAYTAELTEDSSQNARQTEAASLQGLTSGMELLGAAGLESYALWDLSAAAWKQAYGFAPACQKSQAQRLLRGQDTGDDFGMVAAGDRGKAADAAWDILLENGFLSGKADSSFSETAVSAVRRAQKYLDLVETGCMDAQLEAAMAAGYSQPQPQPCQETALGDTAAIGIARYWFARSVSAMNNPESMYAVLNSDNALLVADGCIRNLSAEQLHLFMQPEARLVYNGTYSFETEIFCEASNGQQLDSMLLPLAHARLIVCAEIPAHLADDSAAAWSIVWTDGAQSAEIRLQ